MKKPKVYLIPNTLGAEASISDSFPKRNLEVIQSLKFFAVEHLKDTRRFFVRCGLKHKIDESEFIIVNKKTEAEIIDQLQRILKSGNAIGLISDAGCPGIADPGAKVVAMAHANNFEVVPLIGPSSILLALIASGFNGQSFTFHAYLPRKEEERAKALQQMEHASKKSGQTQIFMETPYRNDALFATMLKQLSPKTKVCIAAELSLPTAFIKSKTVQQWRSEQIPKLHKRPSIFLLSA